MATKKIEGWINAEGEEDFGTYRVMRNADISMSTNGPSMRHPRQAVLFFTEPNTGPPKCWTEDEVRAMVRDLYNAGQDGPYMQNTEAMDKVLAKHGLTL